MAKLDKSILEAALVGYQAELDKIEVKMTDIGRQLGIRRDGRRLSAPTASTPESTPPKRKHMSAAARKRIAAAQKKRWAEYHKKKAE